MNWALDGSRQLKSGVPPRIGSTLSSGKGRGWVFWAAAAGLGAGAGVLFFFDPVQWPFYPRCLFHEATGLLCPGCGALRALHELVRGHLAAALHFNPLLMLCLPAAAWQGLRMAWRRPGNGAICLAIRPWWLWSFLAVAVAFTVLRNLPGMVWLGLHP